MKQIIQKIKKKKELSDIPDSLIEETLNKYLEKHNLKIPSSEKSQALIIKEIRAELRRYTGQYNISSKKRLNLLEQNKTEELLRMHSSTKERLPHYDKLIKIISELNPSSIIDLGCGLNPIAIMSRIDKNIVYYAVDIKEKELELVKSFFKKNKINGKVILSDIRKSDNLPQADLCLVLKTLDIIDSKNHKISENLIKNISSKDIVASFATKTLSGRPMNFPRRQWFEKILNSLGYKFKIIEVFNEIFYIINLKD